MAIPDYQTVMLPVLKFLSDEKEHSLREVIIHISEEFELTEEEKKELLPSKTQPIIDNRVGWARTYMKKAGLLEDPKRGYTKITETGIKALGQKPEKINIKFLEKFPKFIEFRTIKKETSKDKIEDNKEIEDITPSELMEKGYNSINASLVQELLVELRKMDPYYFEKVVGDLLSAMGYGKSEITPGSGDGGIGDCISR
jgi:restriction system protein